jgi:hypothetical protein
MSGHQHRLACGCVILAGGYEPLEIRWCRTHLVAPELLKALKGMLEMFRPEGHQSRACDAADAAIAKAEGPAVPVPGPAGRPDWTRKCQTCGATPIVPETGLCGPCTFGEAGTAGGNW